MRLVQFVPHPVEQDIPKSAEPPSSPRARRIGILTEAGVIDAASGWDASAGGFPSDVVSLLGNDRARVHCEEISRRPEGHSLHRVEEVRILSPLSRPSSFRDFYAFEEHVKTARARRNLSVPEEWYRFPVFYFSNHTAISGHDDEVRRPAATRSLDYELEIGCVIGRAGINIASGEASGYIAGYCVLNDWSARDVQALEMRVGLGPAKGKDFATSLGPALVTPDEIATRRLDKGYDLVMVARRNGRELSRGNWKTIHWSFEEMIERASRDAWIYPGDLLGSGTVGTGCILELTPEAAGGWLEPGDRIELEIQLLGTLRNRVS